MAWLAWIAFLLFCSSFLDETSSTDGPSPNSAPGPKLFQSLDDLCVDNIRTQSWWTYSLCFKRSAMQIHVDARTKLLSDKIQLGEYVEDLSSDTRQVYRTTEKTCATTELEPRIFAVRTSVVQIKCCDEIVHLQRQSRHTRLPAGAVPASLGSSTYWAPELASTQAVEELRASRAKASDGSAAPKAGHAGAAQSTATGDAYIHSVEEPTPCNYEINVCSDLVCTNKGHKASPTTQKSGAAQAKATKTKNNPGHGSQTGRKAEKKKSQHPSAKVEPVPVPVAVVAAVAAGPGAVVSVEEQRELRERSREMFYHAYDSYMHNAYPEAELQPISCTGGKFDLIKIPLVTLIDTLDTLVILGNHSEFRRVVHIVSTEMPSFNLDVNVSVFETTIRVLGGLLAAHLMAVDPKLGIYDQHQPPYDGRLLALSLDLGERLMPAFDTRTSIPYGTVNLRYGVPRGETKIASTAGAGSLLLEFQVLSHLTGQARFGEAAYLAMRGLYDRKSPIGLLGKHINTETGQWSEALSGVGSNADSFYEYLLKAYLLFRDKELYGMFSDTYRAIKRFVMPKEHWFTEVDMFSGKLQRKRVENLDAFWPGVEAMLGFSHHGAGQLNTFYSVWQDLGFLPEEIDYLQWQAGKGAVNGLYPLRPELIESTYHQYRTTGDRSWLAAGKVFLESIERFTRTDCGYASVSDVSTMALADTMPSFFLSETCKYLFLLFDEDNFVNHRPYIFSTEAHPFESLQVHFGDVRGAMATSAAPANKTSTAEEKNVAVVVEEGEVSVEGDFTTELVVLKETDSAVVAPNSKKIRKSKKKRQPTADSATSTILLDEVRRHQQNLLQSLKAGAHLAVLPSTVEQIQAQLQRMLELPPVAAVAGPSVEAAVHYLPMKCRKPQWWDKSTSYDSEFLQDVNSNLRQETVRDKVPFHRKIRTRPRSSALPRAAPTGEGALRIRNRLGPQGVAHFSFILLDLVQTVRNWEESRGGPYPMPFPHITKLKWFETNSPLFRHESCLPADQPSKKGGKKSPTSPPTGSEAGVKSQNGAEPIKSVRVEMPALGAFAINVYTDGFMIFNERDGILVEISNIGRTLVLLRENVRQQSKVIMGNVDHFSVNDCRVQVKTLTHTPHHEAGAAEGHTAGAVTELTTFDRPCSVANFGPTLLSEGASFTAASVQYTPGEMLCVAPKVLAALPEAIAAPRVATEGEGGEGMAVAEEEVAEDAQHAIAEQSAAPTPAPQQQQQQQRGASWWEWSIRHLLGSDPTAANNKVPVGSISATGRAAGGKIVLVDRGDCLFEDKANNALKAGAQGLVIRNSEDSVFIMAGKRDVDTDSGGTSSSAPHTSASASASGVLPVTVMLSKSDGDAFETAIREAAALLSTSTSTSASYSIAASVENVILRSEIMGDSAYPKMHMHRKSLFVLGSGRWATLLKATQGKTEDWQLYLMSKEDVYSTHLALVPPNQVRSRNGHLKSMPFTVLQDPVALYLHTYTRKCPGVIRVVGNSVVLSA